MYNWDKVKSEENLTKHGLSFEDAEHVFNGPTLTFRDDRLDYNEPRFITFGLLRMRMVVVAHTPRDRHIRIISMRKANKREQKIYQERLKAR